MTQHNREYMNIARRLIRSLPEFEAIADSDVRIAYLSCDKKKTAGRKAVFAECCRVEEKYSWCCHYDFFIVVYEPNIEHFTERQVEILIQHELHHVGIDYDEEGEPMYYIVPHDVEEFWDIINSHGLAWSGPDGQEGQRP